MQVTLVRRAQAASGRLVETHIDSGQLVSNLQRGRKPFRRARTAEPLRSLCASAVKSSTAKTQRVQSKNQSQVTRPSFRPRCTRIRKAARSPTWSKRFIHLLRRTHRNGCMDVASFWFV